VSNLSKVKSRGNGEGTVYNNGKYWVAQITVGYNPKTGKLKRKSFYGKTKKEVLKKLTQVKCDLNNERYIEPSNIYVGEWALYWLDTFKKNEIMDSTYERYLRLIKMRIAQPFSHVKLKDLTTIEIQNYINSLKNENLTDAYILSIFKKLNSMLSKAVDLGIIQKNYCRNVTLPKSGNKKIISVFTKSQQARFVEQCENDFYGKVFIFLLGTGVRVGEALALTWADINFREELIYICKTAVDIKGKVVIHNKAKTVSGTRYVPMSKKIKSLLEKLYDEQDFENNTYNLLFYNSNFEYISSSNLRWRIKSYCKKANVPCLNIHALRHTFATRAIEQNINIKVLSSILGHKDISITLNVYSHILTEFQKESMKKIDVFF